MNGFFDNLWRLATSRDVSPLVQFMKYAVVGGLSTVVHIVTFFIVGMFLLPCVTENDIMVRLLRLKPKAVEERRRARNASISNIVAFTVSNVFCYVLNRLFVFQPGRHCVAVEFLLFFGVSAVAIALGTAIMRWLIRRFGMQTTLAFGANLVTSLVFNFVLRKFFVFNG